MPVPKKRGTRSARGQRRSHDALKIASLVKCPSCNELTRPHMACDSCGTYRGTKVKQTS